MISRREGEGWEGSLVMAGVGPLQPPVCATFSRGLPWADWNTGRSYSFKNCIGGLDTIAVN